MMRAMAGPRRAASRVKSALATRMPAKSYWWLMGRFRAVPAVTSQYSTVGESLESGRAVVELLDRLGVVQPNATTLHIGSGIGRVEYHLAPRVRQCYGADISASMVDKASSLVTADNVEFVCTDGAGLSRWADASLDLVLSFFVFQHVPRATFAHYLVEAHRTLRPGGALVFQMMVDEAGRHPDPPRDHPYELRHYTRADLLGRLEATGFADLRTVDMHGDPDAGEAEGDVVFIAHRP